MSKNELSGNLQLICVTKFLGKNGNEYTHMYNEGSGLMLKSVLSHDVMLKSVLSHDVKLTQ